MPKPPKIRCAIYTRKSHEEGLDQEFNSLDAQRVAAEAYVQSQMHEGWEALPTHYDDGGYSGGTLERPALQKLLKDIEDGLVDVIVVYKVDRLSRSLSDFAKLVDVFEKHDVSFVSVTQQFNTTNSMGRLTLNILLSFAQFEREVTGERIRDKFAASKKKGIWMGGVLPLGYDVKDRKLVVNEEEAGLVRLIFEKYLELKSLDAVRDYLNDSGYRLKRWQTEAGKIRGGGVFARNTVRTLLTNPLYLGKIRHKDKVYDGEHEVIITQELWDAVQVRMKQNANARSPAANRNHDILFKGKLFDATGTPYSTTYTKRDSKRYHYYLNKQSKHRISVAELNTVVENAVSGLSLNEITLPESGLTVSEMQPRYLSNIDRVVKQAVNRIVMGEGTIEILIGKEKLARLLRDAELGDGRAQQDVGIPSSVQQTSEYIMMLTHITFKSYAGRKLACTPNGATLGIAKSNHDEALVNAIVKSYRWNKMLETGQTKSIAELAKSEN
ncbi:MAG: recombinase family protein, partial [Rickettsiales bacterium]|nr:recombinase family protein [Rickettsiales bacterium]